MKKKIFFLGLFSVMFIIIIFLAVVIFSKPQQFLDDSIPNNGIPDGNISDSDISDSNTSVKSSFENSPMESFLDFIRTDSALKNNYSLMSLNAVNIDKRYDDVGNVFYFAETIPQFMWGSGLYMIVVDDGKIVNVIGTGLCGNREYFSYDVVNMSQGVFVAAFCATHMGNGNLDLVPISEPGKIKYTIPRAVDHHYEDMALTAVEFGLASEADGTITASAIYLGGRLNADYIDVNQDGNTDIVLTGVQQVYETGTNHEQILRQVYYIKLVYLYDPIEDDFILNDAMSERVLVDSF